LLFSSGTPGKLLGGPLDETEGFASMLELTTALVLLAALLELLPGEKTDGKNRSDSLTGIEEVI